MIKRRTEIISPAWDSAADDLRRFGHAELETLTQKLDRRCTDLQEKAQTSKDRMIFHRFALRAFKASAAQHGQDTPVIRAVYPSSGAYLDEWIGGSIGEREPAGLFWVTYSPDPKALKEVGLEDAAHLDAISDVYEFESRHTWQDGIDRATAGLSESKEQYHQITRTIAVLRFRLSILRNVLWQYECFGYVATWEEIYEDGGLSAEGLHHERTLKIGSALLDYYQQHSAFPELDIRPQRLPGRIIATYDYVDADGSVLCQVVRKEGKVFTQRRPDGRGGWIYNTRAVKPVLYQLPSVLEAMAGGRVVFVVEGEKDVHTLCAQGFVATCNRGGAGKWNPAYAETLRGARVVILPDNDAPGRSHAFAVAHSLVAAETRIVALSGLPPKGDVTDWFEAGGTPEQLQALVRAAPAYVPGKEATENGAQVGVLVSDVQCEQIQWLWPGRIPLGKLTILDGDPGLGKSTLLCDIAARITTGRPLPTGESCPPGGVVILSTEDGIADTIRPRLEAAGADLTRCLVVQVIPESNGPGHVPVIPDDLPALASAVRRVEARLLVIDPLMAHLGGQTQSHRDQDVRRALAPLSLFAQQFLLAVVVIRHLNKRSGGSPLYRGGGSIGIIGAARVGLLVAADPADDDRKMLACTKINVARMPASLAFRVISCPDRPEVSMIRWEGASPLNASDLLTAPVSQGSSKVAEAVDWLTERLAEGPPPAAEIYDKAEAAGITKITLRRAKKEAGVITERIRGISGSGYWIWQLTTEPKASKVISRARDHLSDEALQETKVNRPFQPVLDDVPKVINPQNKAINGFDDHLSENGVSRGTAWEDFEV